MHNTHLKKKENEVSIKLLCLQNSEREENTIHNFWNLLGSSVSPVRM